MRLILIFILLAAPVAIADEDVSWLRGPIELSNQYPVSFGHLSITPEKASLLPEETIEVKATASWSSTLSFKDTLVADAESRELRIGANYGYSNYFEYGFELPLLWRGSGILDHTINQWHETFGLPKNSRDNVSDDEFFFAGYDETGGTRFGSPIVSAKVSLVPEILSSDFAVTLPIGSSAYSGDSADFRFQLLANKQWERFGIYAGASYSYIGNTSGSELLLTRHNPGGFLYLDYLLIDYIVLNIGFLTTKTPVDKALGVSNMQYYVDFGAVISLAESAAFEFLLRENPINGDDSTDFTAHFGLRYYIPGASA